MPSKSKAQANLMRAAAHDPKIAASNKIPQSVAKEFTQADKAAGRVKGSTGKRKS